MKKTLILGAVAAAFSTGAFAEPSTYTIDPTHTFASFEYTHLGFSKQRSRFNERLGEMATTFRELATEVPAPVPEPGGCLVCPEGPVAGEGADPGNSGSG